MPALGARGLLAALALSLVVGLAAAAEEQKSFPKGLQIYCKEENCYNVLNITQQATASEIKKAYRRLSLINHPDKSDKHDAAERFMVIATAYEVLSNDRTRKAYDDFLANPGRHVWQHYSAYYQAYYAPKSDLRVVVAGIILAFSAIQYASAAHKIARASAHILADQKTKNQVSRRAQELAGKVFNLKKQKDYEEFLKFEKLAQKEVLDKTMLGDLNLGAGVQLSDTLLASVILLPLDMLHWCVFEGRWLWRFAVMRQEYGDFEREYLTRKACKKLFKADVFPGYDDEKKDTIIEKEIWIKENFDKYKEECMQEARAAYNKFRRK